MTSTQKANKEKNGKSMIRKALTLSAIAMLMAGCAQNREVTNSIPYDYQDRHPIIVGSHQKSIDLVIAPKAGMLDPAQVTQVQQFAGEYKIRGTGALMLQLPMSQQAATGGAGQAKVSKSAVASAPAGIQEDPTIARSRMMIMQALRDAGVSPASVKVAHYQPIDTKAPAVISLSYVKHGAQVATRCGQWPQDLGSHSFSTENRNYWNFGCATQNVFAAQVANPMDLIQPRAEAPIYAPRRDSVLSTYRSMTSSSGSESGATSTTSGGSQ